MRPNDQMVHTNLSRAYMKAGDKETAEHHGLQARIASWRGNMAPPPPAAGGFRLGNGPAQAAARRRKISRHALEEKMKITTLYMKSSYELAMERLDKSAPPRN